MASGVAAVGARTLQAGLFLAAAVALARILTPEDFGVFAMILPVGLVAGSVTNRTVQTALLQAGEVSEADFDAFFWLIARVTALVAAALAASGLVLSSFYSEPRVVAIAVAWSALLFLLVPATFQEARLKRDLRFPAVMAVQVTTLGLGILASLGAALAGWGYWALALQIFVMEVSRAGGIMMLSDWRPRRPRRVADGEVSALRRAWLHLVGLRLANWLTRLPSIVAVGRVGGATVLGHYDTARRWASYPFDEPFLALTEVAIASLRPVREDAERFRRLAGRAIFVMLTISLPGMAFMAVEPAPVVLVVLGPQWVDAIWFLHVLSWAAFATALVRVNRWIFLARGETGRLLGWSLFVEAPVVIVAVLVGVSWGARGVAVAIAISSAALVLPAIHYAVRGSSISFADVVRAAARPTVASVAAAGVVWALGGSLPPGGGVDRLFAALGLYVVGFLAAWHALPGGLRDTRALLATLKELLPVRGSS